MKFKHWFPMVLFALVTQSAHAQNFRSPLIFQIFQDMKTDGSYRTKVMECENSLTYCDEYFVMSTHPEFGDIPEYPTEGLSSKLNEYYDTHDFPNDFMTKMLEAGIPTAVVDLVKTTPQLEASYFEGSVHSEGDVEAYEPPVFESGFSIRDTRTNEVIFIYR